MTVSPIFLLDSTLYTKKVCFASFNLELHFFPDRFSSLILAPVIMPVIEAFA